MNVTPIINRIIDKSTVRAFSLLIAVVLITGGIYMCFNDLSSSGEIDLKATFVEGKIKTGSLGVMAMFLGTLIVLSLNHSRNIFKGQEIEITVNGYKIKGKGLSYRKLQELVSLASSNSSSENIEKSYPGSSDNANKPRA